MFIIKVSSNLTRKHSPRCGSPNLSRQGVSGSRPCHSECTVCQSCIARSGAVLGKKIGGGELAPHHLGGNNEQNYCVQLSSIKPLMYRNYPENLRGGWARFGGPVPPWPKPRTATVQDATVRTNCT